MKIRVLYDNNIKNGHRNYTTIEVPDGDYRLLLDADYEQRLAEVSPDKADTVKRYDTLQDLFDSMNDHEYNNWRKHQRHIGESKAKPEDDDEDLDATEPLMSEVADDRIFRRDEIAREEAWDEEELKAKIRAALKPDYAEMIIAIHIDGMSCIEYAKSIGQKPNTVNHRLQRAEKKFKEVWGKRPF